MKKVIIIHGWESNPKEHWYQEEKAVLGKLGYKVFVPEMPNANFPKLNEWLKAISELGPDAETVMIGHSLGVPAILRYLETTGQQIDKAIFVAGFAKSLGFAATDNFLLEPFDWPKIKRLANDFVVLNQDCDPWVSLGYGQEIADALGVEMQVVTGNNHFDTMDLELINKWL